MKSGAGVILLLAFGALLVLIALLGTGTMRRINQMSDQIMTAQQVYEDVDSAIRDLPAAIHSSGSLVRDYLLDPSPSAAPEYRAQLKEKLSEVKQHVTRLSLLASVDQGNVARLQHEILAYASSLDPILDWTPAEKLAKSRNFIQYHVIPRRQAIVASAHAISKLNAHNLAIQHQALDRSRESLQRFVRNLVAAALCLGFLIAFASTRRVIKLDRQSRLQRERAEEAERDQRRLAACVVRAQEEERKRISLELHDTVGQMASAVGIELGQLESLHQISSSQFHEKLCEVKRLNAEIIRALKDLATGLRPAMLDQLGLGSALRAHAREFARRTGIQVDVRLDGELDSVPEPQRTAVYRIVQEALNNCGRHAHASHAIIALYGGPSLISLTVQDDGVGFDPAQRSKTGLGLIGIEERARDLNGKVVIVSKPGHGALLEIELPVQEPVNA